MSPELPEALRVALLVGAAFDDLGIAYHLGGSFASSIHGVPRQTQDLDIVVELSADSVAALSSRLAGEFHVDPESARRAVRERSSFNLVHLDSGIKVDLFIRGNEPFDREEFRRHRAEFVQMDPERRLWVKSAEDTLLRKLQWYRLGGGVSERQWADVLGIARIQGERLDGEYLRRWAGEIGVGDLLERVLRAASGGSGAPQG